MNFEMGIGNCVAKPSRVRRKVQEEASQISEHSGCGDLRIPVLTEVVQVLVRGTSCRV